MAVFLQVDWVGITQRVGLPLVAVFALAFVIYKVAVKAVWPYFQARLQRADAQRSCISNG